MIARLYEGESFPSIALSAALGRPIAEQDVLADVVAASAPLDSGGAAGSREAWRFADWQEYLLAPRDLHPHAAAPGADEPEIFHLAVRLHAADRTLRPPEWSEIAERLARAAGLTVPGAKQACRWVALQARPGRLVLVANLIRGDGGWARQPYPLREALRGECRRIEADLGLVSAQPHGGRRPLTAERPADQSPPAVAARLATLVVQLADEATGPLAAVRGMVEQTAYQLAELPHAYGPEAGHRLEWIARRLHGIQQDLDATAAGLPGHRQRAGTAARRPLQPPAASSPRCR
ncbi:relaxase/mobilization nuclease [Streptomyces sp. p1417]|uniref:Relaxase/mobilization nuclease n=1 Tax=Streptomyces typhae TaxID=2681492 RepID=A0A6L6X8Z1_9ACTN|nr:relaxase/mobilization nuclease [Streptomyces typhae]MVO90302.1 relaxase/mobilization nuclease [Streptomyces typhae]